MLRPSKSELEAALKGRTFSQAAKKFGVTRSTLNRWRKKYDMPFNLPHGKRVGKPPKRRRLRFPQLRDIEFLAEREDLTDEELAAEVGCHLRTAQDARSKARYGAGITNWCQAEEEALHKFHFGVPATLLGEALGRGKHGVYSHAKQMGLEKKRCDFTEEQGEQFWSDWREWLVERFPAWRENGDWVYAMNLRWRPPLIHFSLGCDKCEMTGCKPSEPLPCEYVLVGDMVRNG